MTDSREVWPCRTSRFHQTLMGADGCERSRVRLALNSPHRVSGGNDLCNVRGASVFVAPDGELINSRFFWRRFAQDVDAARQSDARMLSATYARLIPRPPSPCKCCASSTEVSRDDLAPHLHFHSHTNNTR